LDETKQQQVIALGRLGWSLRRIEAATQRAPRDDQWLSESGRRRGAATRGPADAVAAAKSGHHG
jgi:hypothetical protein